MSTERNDWMGAYWSWKIYAIIIHSHLGDHFYLCGATANHEGSSCDRYSFVDNRWHTTTLLLPSLIALYAASAAHGRYIFIFGGIGCYEFGSGYCS